jgi:hypothetical protein
MANEVLVLRLRYRSNEEISRSLAVDGVVLFDAITGLEGVVGRGHVRQSGWRSGYAGML